MAAPQKPWHGFNAFQSRHSRRRERRTKLTHHDLRRFLTDYTDRTLPQRHAENTRNAYNGHYKRWLEFCEDCGFRWNDWDCRTTLFFVAWRRCIGTNMHSKSGKPCKAKTIRANLSGIRAELMNHGMVNPKANSKYTMPRTAALLMAIERNEECAFKLALKSEHLAMFFTYLSAGKHNCRVLRWVLAVIHNTMRRACEIMPKLDEAAITAGDIVWSNGTWQRANRPPYDDAASYFFRRSKTNKDGELQTAFMWHRCPETVCALCELEQLYARCPWPVSKDWRLLQMENGSILNYGGVMRMLKKLCGLCGLNPADYGIHSLRRGGLHDAQDENLPDSLINAQAFWRSNSSRLPYERERQRLDQQKRKLIGLSVTAGKGKEKLNRAAKGSKGGRKRRKRQKRKKRRTGKIF